MRFQLIQKATFLTGGKPMSDNVFFDTNIIVYSYSNSEADKQSIARLLISTHNSYVSTQVLQELTNTLTKKFKFSYENAIDTIIECCKNNHLYINSDATILEACKVAARYRFSFYDSLIISAALACECSILYTEDLQNGLVIGKLKIINPFAGIKII